MLLAVDIGNTDAVLGLFRGRILVFEGRCESRKIFSYLKKRKRSLKGVKRAIISSVVPSLNTKLRSFIKRDLKVARPIFVTHKIKLPIKLKVKRPREVGADRIVNNAAAYLKYKRSLLIVDFGTATTIDYIDKQGAYIGGVIMPGFHTAALALFSKAAKLHQISYKKSSKKPGRILGKDTHAQLQSGILTSHAAMIDRMIEKIFKEVDHRPKIIVTGGLSRLIIPLSKYLKFSDGQLTLRGLQQLYALNA